MMTPGINPPKVFISYSHDSPEHADRVLDLADRLRMEGIDATIDQYVHSPGEGWPLWMHQQIRDADFVLMVCTETYHRRVMAAETPGIGHGVRWEGNLIFQHLYNAASRNEKFIPILFDQGDSAYVPLPVQGRTFYNVNTVSDYDKLYRLLTSQLEIVRPPIGTIRQLPPRERQQDSSADPLRPLISEASRASLSTTQRLELIQELNAMSEVQLEALIFALNPPRGQIPPMAASQGSRVNAFLQWAEGTGGCGLAAVKQALEAIVPSHAVSDPQMSRNIAPPLPGVPIPTPPAGEDPGKYRTPGTPAGYFHERGYLHVHIDAGTLPNYATQLYGIVQSLEMLHFPGKVNRVREALPGSQRRDRTFEATYNAHTPEESGEEGFAVFSTTRFGTERRMTNQVKDGLGRLLGQLTDARGAVVEVERVIATISATGPCGTGGKWEEASPALVESIDEDFGQAKFYAFPIEIHQAIDIPKKPTEVQGNPPIGVKELLEDTAKIGIRVGGWFLFEKDDTWSYRSNMFTGYDDYKEKALEYHARLAEFLRNNRHKYNFQYKLWTLVEQILGIWNLGRQRDVATNSLVTVPQLAKWEKACPQDSYFWVVAANFLGDKDPDVAHAMLENLRQNVRYTYFLHSFADLRRLRQLVDRLADVGGPTVRQLINAVVLWPSQLVPARRGLFESDYFVAMPGGSYERAEGYQLNRDRGYVTSGTRLDSGTLQKIIGQLRPLVETSESIAPPGLRISDPPREEKTVAVVCTKLVNLTAFMESSGRGDWEHILEVYDGFVATEASKTDGTVVKALGDGYVLTFDNAAAALICAKRLQRTVDEHNRRMRRDDPMHPIPDQQIGLDFGRALWVERAHGYDLSSLTPFRCLGLTMLAHAKHILMTGDFYYGLQDPDSREEANIKALGDTHLVGFRRPIKVFEFLWSDEEGCQIPPMGPFQHEDGASAGIS